VLVIGGPPQWADSLRESAGLVHLRMSSGGFAVEGAAVRRPARRTPPFPSVFFRRIYCHLDTAAHHVPQTFPLLAAGGLVVLERMRPMPAAERAGWTARLRAAGLVVEEGEKGTSIIGRRAHFADDGDPECVFCTRYRFRMNTDAGVPGAAGVLWGDDDLWCVPDLAPLRQGHLLLVSTAHYPCYGACPPGLLLKLGTYKTLVARMLTDVYDLPVTFFEHGPATSQGGGSCIDHAHLHCVPGVPSLRGEIEAQGLDGRPVEPAQLVDLYGSRTSYLYVEDDAGPVAYPCGKPLPPQFLRKAAVAGSGPWRWQESYGTLATRELFLETLRRLLPCADRLLTGQAESSHRNSRAVILSPKPMGSDACS
jgi:diadenosine tetraphosphate (Ap4A) HIT family hydrolase